MISDIKDFHKFITSNKIILIYFWAPWCVPCRILLPKIENLSKIYENTVLVGKVNVDRNHDLAYQYQVNSIPTLICLKECKEIDRCIGNVSEWDISNKINKLI